MYEAVVDPCTISDRANGRVSLSREEVRCSLDESCADSGRSPL